MGLYDFAPNKNNNSQTRFIANPLPVPKRKEHVEMDYDHVIPEDKMHYDIENPSRFYFDIE